jgi:hypothetical protein
MAQASSIHDTVPVSASLASLVSYDFLRTLPATEPIVYQIQCEHHHHVWTIWRNEESWKDIAFEPSVRAECHSWVSGLWGLGQRHMLIRTLPA